MQTRPWNALITNFGEISHDLCLRVVYVVLSCFAYCIHIVPR